MWSIEQKSGFGFIPKSVIVLQALSFPFDIEEMVAHLWDKKTKGINVIRSQLGTWGPVSSHPKN